MAPVEALLKNPCLLCIPDIDIGSCRSKGLNMPQHMEHVGFLIWKCKSFAFSVDTVYLSASTLRASPRRGPQQSPKASPYISSLTEVSVGTAVK